MRAFRIKLAVLLLSGAFLPAFFLQCDKASLNFQRGFWSGLGDSVSDILTGTTGANPAP